MKGVAEEVGGQLTTRSVRAGADVFEGSSYAFDLLLASLSSNH